MVHCEVLLDMVMTSGHFECVSTTMRNADRRYCMMEMSAILSTSISSDWPRSDTLMGRKDFTSSLCKNYSSPLESSSVGVSVALSWWAWCCFPDPCWGGFEELLFFLWHAGAMWPFIPHAWHAASLNLHALALWSAHCENGRHLLPVSAWYDEAEPPKCLAETRMWRSPSK